MLYVLAIFKRRKSAKNLFDNLTWPNINRFFSSNFITAKIPLAAIKRFVITALQGDRHAVESHLFKSWANNFGNQPDYSANR